MAIKINGTTVIDDNRNIINITDVTASNTVTANTFIGNASRMTGLFPKMYYFGTL